LQIPGVEEFTLGDVDDVIEKQVVEPVGGLPDLGAQLC
jgi:hypothetical protein